MYIFKLLSIPLFFLTAIIFIYCFMIVLRSFRQKRKSTAIALMVMFVGCIIINIFSGMDALFYNESWGYTSWGLGLPNLRLGYAVSLIFTAIAVIGLLYFSTEVFASGGTVKTVKYGRFILSIALLVVSIWGTILLIVVPEGSTPGETPLPLMVMFMMNLTLYVILGIRAYHLANRVDDPTYKKSIRYIGHFAWLNLAIYPSFIGDSILATYILQDLTQVGATYWSTIGAAVFVFLAYLCYVGFVKPMLTKT